MGKRVLVIEDNRDNLKLITYVLGRGGYEVDSADDGEKGVEMAAAGDYEFVVMDINLPGIDGLEATRQIRSSERGKKVPIIAITSFAMTGDRDKVIAAGCNGYFEKPIDPLTLMNSINEIIGREKK